ncbi:RHS repeat-associated core domain-containing protein [Amycolatopsis tolypomycina]|uniref:RHS repeat-associated core domain-containing protein n=1 Tax=Amycolatopsis tolypomycina TaxID=208445 RepID=UPI0033B6E99E
MPARLRSVRRPCTGRALLVVLVLALFCGVAGPAGRFDAPGSLDDVERLEAAMALAPKQKPGAADGYQDSADGPGNVAGPRSLQSKYPPITGTGQPASASVRAATGPTNRTGFDAATSKELPRERTAKERTFANTDGTLTTQFNAEDVNYRTADGTYQPIETNLVPRAGGGWRNAADAVSLEFAATGVGSPLVDVRLDADHAFGYAVDQSAPAAGVVAGATLTYPAVRPDSDVRIDVVPGGFKETIVLRTPDAPRSWLFPLHLRGLRPAVVEGRVALFDEAGRERAHIPAGFMTDASRDPLTGEPAASTGVTYRIIDLKSGPALQVDLDSNWLTDPARRFPVEVDPSVDTSSANASMVVQNGSRFDGGSELKAGTTGSLRAASYLAFDGVQDRLRNHKIFGAYLNLANSWSWSCQPRPLTVHAVTSPWGSSGGYPGPGFGPALVDASFAHGYIGRGQTRSSCPAAYELMNLGEGGRDLVQRWVTGAQANYGLTIRGSETDPFGWKKFAGHRTANPPQLYVTHTVYDAEYRVVSATVDPPVTRSQNGKIKITVTNRGVETWTPANYALGYRAFRTSGAAVASTEAASLPGDVPRGASVTLEATIKAIEPGDYLFDFSMLRRGGPWFTDEQIAPIRLALRVVDVPPVVKAQYPPNGYSAPTLTPQLWLDAVDVDAPPTTSLKYRFEICEKYQQNSDGTQTGVNCTNSGHIAKRTWAVPAGALRWSKAYQWRAFAFDGTSESEKLPPSHLLTAVPQPEITSHLANAPYSGTQADFDPQTGNYHSSAVDATATVTGPELSIARTYNSLDPRRDLLFGTGWSTRYDMRVTPDDDGSGNVVVTIADGQQIRFGRNADGSFAAPEGRPANFRSELEAAGGGWVLVDQEQTAYRFRPDGRLIAVYDQAGRYIELDYGTVDRLKRVISRTSDRIFYFTYSGSHVSSVSTDPVDGKQLTWRYTYDGDKLTQVCDPYGGCTRYDQVTGSHYRSTVTDARPASYWRLGEPSGTSANSQVATNLGKDKATLQDVGLGVPGAPAESADTAAAFNGTSSTMTLPDGTLRKNRDLSVELWFKTAQGGPLAGYQKSALGTTSATGVPLLYVGTDGKLRGQFWNGTVAPITSAGTVTDDQWHHVVLSGTLATQTLFLDGQKVGSVNGDISHDELLYNQVGAAYASNPAGWPAWGTTSRRFFSGQIDEVAFYEYALGQTAAQAHFRARAAADYVSKITLPSGRTAVQLQYDKAADRLSEYTDRHGGRWKIVSPIVTGTATNIVRTVQVTDPGNRLHFYDYDPVRGRILRYVAPLGLGIRPEDRRDGVGNPAPPSVPGCPADIPSGYCGGPVGGSTWVGGPVMGLGVRTYDYDEKGFQTTIGDELGNQVVLTHDEQGNIVSRKSCRIAPGNCQTSYYTYYVNANDFTDPRNNKVLSARDARSANTEDQKYATTYTYTGGTLAGLLESQTTPDGGVVRHVYTDGTEAAVGGGNAPRGLIEQTTDPRGGVITYSYYRNGDLAKIVNAAGLTTTFTYDVLGRKKTETQISAANPGGLTTTFAYDSLSHQLSITSPGSVNPVTGVTHTAQKTTEYDADGNVTRVEERDLTGGDPSRVTTTEYDGSGRPSRVTDPEGGSRFVGYDTFGNQTWLVDPDGNKYEYAYTARNAIAEVRLRSWHGQATDPGDDGGDGEGDGVLKDSLVLQSYAYDFSGRLTRQTDAMGRTTRYQYYTDDRLWKTIAADVTDPDNPAAAKRNITLSELTYDAAGNVTKEVKPGGRVTTYEYDTTGRRTAQTADPAGLANRSEFVYSQAGDLTKITHTGLSSNSSRIDTGRVETTEYGYDVAGRKVSDTVHNRQTEKFTTSWTFDQRGLITSVTDARGNLPGADPAPFTTTYGYDKLGLRTSVTGAAVSAETNGEAPALVRPQVVTGYDTFGQPTDVRDPAGQVSTTRYDRAGRVVESASPEYRKPGDGEGTKAVTRTEYDPAGNVKAVTGPLGAVTRYRYDQLGRLVEKIDPKADAGDQPGGVWQYTYTVAGDRLSVTDPTGSRAETTYDDLARPITRTQLERRPEPAAYTTKLRYDDAGNLKTTTSPTGEVEQYGYDAIGQLTSRTDPAGVVTQSGYDLAGNQVRSTDGRGHTVFRSIDPAGRNTGVYDLDAAEHILRKTSSAYDAVGNLLSATDPYNRTTRYEYDNASRLVKQQEPVSATETITTTYGYDVAGQRTRVTDGRGNSTIRTYNSLKLPESVIEPSTSADPTLGERTWTTGYDLAGAPVSLLAPGGVTRQRTFDALGRLSEETGTGAAEATASHRRSYDLAGRLRTVDTPGGDRVFTYNDRGALLTTAGPVGGTSTYQYDGSGRLRQRTDAAGTTLFTYDRGRLATQSDSITGVTQTVGYDAAGAPAELGYGDRKRVMTYDDFGRPKSDTLKTGDGSVLASIGYGYDLNDRLKSKDTTGPAGSQANAYEYDFAGRLTSWTANGTKIEYGWDASGNRTKAGGTVSTFDERNRRLTEGSATFTWEPRGTLASRTDSNGTVESAFDAFDRQVKHGQGIYAYDGLDRTVSRNGQNFEYDGAGRELVSDGAGTYARGVGGGLLAQRTSSGTPQLTLTDAHSDVVGGLDPAPSGGLTGSMTYSPFGERVASTGANGSLGFQSDYTDSATGAVDMGARWYMPGTGTFTARDDIELSGSPSIASNRYTYGNGTPVNAIDPDGHLPWYCYVVSLPFWGLCKYAEAHPTGRGNNGPELQLAPPNQGYDPFKASDLWGGDWGNGTSTNPGTGPGRGGRPGTGTSAGRGGGHGGPPAVDYRAAGQAAVKHNPLPVPKAATQPVYGNNGGIKPPVSSSPNLPASGVAQTVVGDPNTQKITQAVTGQNPVVRTVGQVPVSELAPSGPAQAPGFTEQVTGLMNLIPFSGLSVAWRLVTADSWADAGHQLLDLVGYIPIAGEVADGANALWYLGEGDGLNAGLSAAAAVPIVGWAAAAAKTAKQGAKSLERAAAGAERQLAHAASPVTIGSPESLFKNIDDDVVFHYTDDKGLQGIINSGSLRADSKGRVYVTQEMLSANSTWTSLFAGNPAYLGKGGSMLALRVPSGVSLRLGEQVNELIHQGSWRFSEADIVYAGVNPFG